MCTQLAPCSMTGLPCRALRLPFPWCALLKLDFLDGVKKGVVQLRCTNPLSVLRAAAAIQN